MRIFLLRRSLHSIFVLFSTSVIVFLFLHLSGDPARLLISPEASEEEVAQFRKSLGLEDPLYIQYGRFFKRAVQGDFGMSFRHSVPAFSLVLKRMPATIELAFSSLCLAVFLAIPMGIISAIRRNTIADYVVRVAALLGQSIPTFWLGIMLILIFSVKLQLFPTFGRGGLRHLVLPSVALAAFLIARLSRFTRSGMLEIIGLDYIRTARAKGVVERRVILFHAFKNALIPIVTLVGMELGALLGGAIVTETIFAWPGVGRLAIQAIYGRDFPVVQASVMLFACIFVVVNFLVDLLYTYLDPRLSYE